jgi:hypothetical protein
VTVPLPRCHDPATALAGVKVGRPRCAAGAPPMTPARSAVFGQQRRSGSHDPNHPLTVSPATDKEQSCHSVSTTTRADLRVGVRREPPVMAPCCMPSPSRRDSRVSTIAQSSGTGADPGSTPVPRAWSWSGLPQVGAAMRSPGQSAPRHTRRGRRPQQGDRQGKHPNRSGQRRAGSPCRTRATPRAAHIDPPGSARSAGTIPAAAADQPVASSPSGCAQCSS